MCKQNRYLSRNWSRGGSRPLSLSIARQAVTVVGLAVKFPCKIKKTDTQKQIKSQHK